MTATHKENQTIEKKPSTTALPERPRRKFGSVMIVLLVLIAIGCSFYSLYRSMQSSQGTSSQLNGLRAKISAMNRLQHQSDEKIESSFKQIDETKALTSSLDKHVQLVLQSQTYQSNDWTLLKARYYLELAQMNASWSDNVEATIALLTQADLLLASIHDTQLLDVRRAIADEKNRLVGLEKLDKTGLLTQLDALQTLCDQLVVHQTSVGLEKNSDQTTVGSLQSKSTSSWREGLKNSLNALEKLVVVQRDDGDIRAIITPAYAMLLREEVHLILQETQLAVIQGNEPLYQLTLKQALKKITQSFSHSEPLLNQLHALQKVRLVQQKAEIGQALSLLNKLIDSKQTIRPANAALENGVSAGAKL
jgi:uroporphyrin-3 C-methyltransferase